MAVNKYSLNDITFAAQKTTTGNCLDTTSFIIYG
jgi:hypothetical protein